MEEKNRFLYGRRVKVSVLSRIFDAQLSNLSSLYEFLRKILIVLDFIGQ
ncbi:MAG: hypothetical protein NHB15_21305 [Methanosarcina barkeri]|nr:hypothetical protein [Methanosarcina sp. ERenArc_MAG2]